jgi:hypothetical protein
VLAAVALGLAVVAPFAVFVSGAPDPALAMSPRPGDALQHPFALVIELILTGAYPAVAWTAYLCAGLAIGRLDLLSKRLGWFLVGSGVAVALAAWWTSWLLLYRAGGLQHIRDALPPGQHWSDMRLLWDPPPSSTASWWFLVERAPRTPAHRSTCCTPWAAPSPSWAPSSS